MHKLGLYLNNRLGRNMLLSSICRPLSMLISYIYIPLVLNYLGDEKYGIWSTILTIISWVHYFDIGIGNGLRNKLTESLAKRDGKSRDLVSSAYVIIAIIMTAFAVLFSLAASIVNWETVFGVKNIKDNLYAVVTVSVIFIAINFVFSLCKNILYAMQKAAVVSASDLAVQILNIIGLLVISRFSDGNLFLMAVAYGLAMLLVNIITSIILFTRHKDVSPSLKYVNLESGKKVTSLGVQFFIVQICALILFTTDSLIISYMYGAVEVTPYSMVNKIFNIIISVYAALLTPTWSDITKANAEKDYDHINKLLRALNMIMSIFFGFTLILLIVFRPLSGWWLGKDLNYTSVLIVFGALYCVLTIWCNTYSYFTNAMEIMKVPRIVAIVQAIINLPLSLFFAEVLNLKVAGVLAGTVLTMFIPAIVLPILLKKEIRIKRLQQW